MSNGHAKLGPSSAGRWVHCPGSIGLEARYPDDGHDGAAGTASHWVCSELLTHGRVRNMGETAPNGVVLDKEMVAGALVYAQAVSAATPPGTVLQVEQAVGCYSIHAECWGTPDLWYYLAAQRELHVWDYKYGWTVVEALENWQLICYASGVLDLLSAQTGVAGGILDQQTTVVLHICQPRPSHVLGSVREWRVPASDLRAHINMLSAAAFNAMSGAPVCNTGVHCKYCRARHACVALQHSVYSAIDYSEQATAHDLDLQALAIELDALERAGEAIKYRLTGLTAQAVATIGQGGFVPGWTVQRSPGRSTWNTEVEQVFATGDLLGVDLRAPLAPITPVQAKKAGLPAEVVNAMSSTPLGDPKLVRDTKTIAAQAFSQAARQGA